MKNEFGAPEDLSQAPDIFHDQNPMLSPRQFEIHKNLQAIGPEIAAYYLDGLKILHSNDLENAASFLAHAAREIDGGLRDILDDEALTWLKFSAKHTDFYFDIFVSALLTHVSKTPMEVGIIYLELSKSSRFTLFTSLPAEDKVIETIRILYDGGHKDTANQICIQFAENGFDFLNALYNEYQN